MEVKFTVAPTNRATREAFVLFADHEDIEKALSMDLEKIMDIPVEIYRSSIAQMQYYTTIPSKKQKSTNPIPTNISTEKIPTALEGEGESALTQKNVDSTANEIICELYIYRGDDHTVSTFHHQFHSRQSTRSSYYGDSYVR